MAIDEEFLRKIVQYLDNTENAEARNEIELLVEQSKGNKVVYDQIISIWNKFPELKKLEYINSDEAVSKIELKLAELETAHVKPAAPQTAFSLLFKWAAAAAAVLLVGFFAYISYNRFEKTTFFVKNTGNVADSVTLADGSIIYMDSLSAIKYPTVFKDKTREITLVQGRAFFKIHRDTLHPFVIKINHSSVTVLGTSFNIDTRNKAIALKVSTGHVKFQPNANNPDGAILHAGTGIIYNEVTGAEQLLYSVGANNQSWFTHELVFVDASLTEVCKQLEEYYKVKIVLKGNTTAFEKLNANFKESKLTSVLEVLHDTYPIKIKQLGDGSYNIQSTHK
ncbi:FecR family protein [Mucilaginibacter gracilis]|uniref:FecR family protein n=1 Tax=Mucilaginibacter gracilis TaxID=423350 RepID=A0A495IXN9_9SPHI|nr:FecR domain-containing protein [Mucilaginibacter gracilis]RKR81460.1 FecR family protein [Mucilaginibacter gracilis]